MNIKHQDIVIPAEEPFKNCKLERKPYAHVLTDIVKTYSDGFVLAINNEWGTGKTTFIRMWQQHLKNEGFQTIYFNAWENDFDSNPLTALLGELHALIGNNIENRALLKKMTKNAATLTKAVLPALAKSLVDKYVGNNFVKDISEAITKGGTEIFENEVKEYNSKKEGLKEFKKLLSEFVKKSSNGKPLILIVDELDRCRPTYAVEVLERMKHFFSVSGIVFVLSIDKNHLASSVRGFYGSEQINTDEYLRRFIDIEYSISKPSIEMFCDYLYEYFSLGDFFASEDRRRITIFQGEGSSLRAIAVILFKNANATLRQQEKIYAQVRLILTSFRSNSYVFPYVLFVLIYLKQFESDLYKKIEQQRLSLQELHDECDKIIPFIAEGINLQFVLALLLHFYNNNTMPHKREKLIVTDEQGNHRTSIESSEGLAGCFKQILNTREYSDTELKYLLDKINLTQPLFQ